MKTSKEAFEAYCWERGFNPEVYPAVTEWQRVWQAATEARDAHWREKLQSEEMAWRCSEALWRRNYPNGGSIYPTYESTPYHDKVIYNEEAKTVIAAISKEMGV